MDTSLQGPSRGHSRNKSNARPIRPRQSTRGPLDDGPINDPLSPQADRLGPSQEAGSGTSSPIPRSPARSPTRTNAPPGPSISSAKDFSYLLKPEIYHQLSPLNLPGPFRNSSKQPAPETPIPELVARGHFRAAAIACVQALTSSPTTAAQVAAHPPVDPTDYARIFELLYTRLACLTLIDSTALAAQEARALEDMNSAFYQDEVSGTHLVPWELRILAVRLQAMGFGDPRREVMSYYELAREARAAVAKAAKAHDNSAKELWKNRLHDLGIKVAGALIEMDDLGGAAHHLSTLKERGDGRMAISKALLWLHLGDVDAAKRCTRDGKAGNAGEAIVAALGDMANGDYAAALDKWRALNQDLNDKGVDDEMVGVNIAVALLYVGRMEEGRDLLEKLAKSGHTSHTLLFNLATMYELCTDRAKGLKTKLAEQVAAMEEISNGWEKTNADFKL